VVVVSDDASRIMVLCDGHKVRTQRSGTLQVGLGYTIEWIAT